MKVGDLVTLSSYGNKLQALQRWSTRYREYQNKTPIVGLIIKVSPSRWPGEGWQYEVKWIEPDGPTGRDGSFIGRGGFIRKDLKYVSKAKLRKVSTGE